MQRLIFLWLCLAWPAAGWSQVGGRSTFDFLRLPQHARLAALGGENVSAGGNEISLVSANPALLQSSMQNQLAFGYTDYVADIRQVSLHYGFRTGKSALWGTGLTSVRYGDLVQRDASGQEEGRFLAQDYMLSLSRSSTIRYFTLATSLKLAVSGIAGYKAVALLTDVGGLFRHPQKDLTVGLAFKNIGYQVKSFTQEQREPTPFDLQLGFTYKPEHMPLRLSLTTHQLHKLDIVYLDTTGNAASVQAGFSPVPEKSLGDKIARHFVIGGELVFSKNFNLRMGYNHLRRKELRMDNASGGAGFSFGTMIRVRSFQLDYSLAFYHPAGATNQFTVGTNLKTILKKKTVKAASG